LLLKGLKSSILIADKDYDADWLNRHKIHMAL